ncbi:MAG: glycosyltransferase [Crocinitomicaceae bacterium]
MPYGFDEADFTGISPNKNPKEFIISHAGLFGRDRYSENFFLALQKLVKENPTDRKITLVLAGQVDYMIKEAIERFGLTNHFKFLGTIPRKESIQLMFDSDVLLLPLNQTGNTHGRIPGKFYENMRTYNQILALGPEDSDVGNMLKETNCGKCIDYINFDEIYSFLHHALIHGNQISINKEAIQNYSNYNLTKKVAGWLNEISK